MLVAVVALAVAGAGLLPFFAVQVAVGAGILAVTPVLLGRRGLPLPQFDLGEWRRLAVATLPVAIAFVLGIVYFRVLVVLMSLTADEVETALFVTSTRIVELLAGLPLLLAGIALPVVAVAARDNPARLRYVLQRMT